MSYPCTGCGLCCMSAGKAVDNARKFVSENENANEYAKEVAAFPYQYDETGRCEMLAEDRSCMVYDDRPDICKIDVTWAKHKSSMVSLPEYYQQSIKVCNDMMREAGLEKFLIDG